MYAIVSIAGQQFKVEKGKKVFVHRLSGEVGEEVSFDKVLLISQDEKTDVGVPYLPDAVVVAQIVSHNRGDKVLVFKKKRRKGYQKLNGHRQDFTQILIEDISETGASARPKKKKTEVVKAKVTSTEVPAEASPEVAKIQKAAPSKAPAKKPAAKAPAKKPAAKAKPVAKTGKSPAKKSAEKPAKPASKKAPAKGKTKEKK